LDVSDPAKPTYLTGAWASSAEDVALMGNYAFVAAGDKGLVVYELQQQLYPPLRPPVVSNGTMTLTWATTNDVRLQKTTNLVNAVWQDVPESEGTNMVALPITEEKAFFRLVKGPKPGQIPQGLVAWWPGDGNANDIIGTNDVTQLNGGGYAQGVVGQGFEFSDVDACVMSTNETQGWPEGTVELWFRVNQWVPDNSLVGLYVWAATANAPPSGSLDGLNLGTLPWETMVKDELMFGLFDFRNGSWRWARSGIVPQPQVWYHAAGTWGTGGISIYVDGNLRGTHPYAGPAPAETRYDVIGRSSWPETGATGVFDEVSLYNRALTAEEIKAIYDAGSAGKEKPH
jgi:hypothetical protein